MSDIPKNNPDQPQEVVAETPEARAKIEAALENQDLKRLIALLIDNQNDRVLLKDVEHFVKKEIFFKPYKKLLEIIRGRSEFYALQTWGKDSPPIKLNDGELELFREVKRIHEPSLHSHGLKPDKVITFQKLDGTLINLEIWGDIENFLWEFKGEI